MKTPNSKIIFFGTPDVSATVLESLVGAGYAISLVVTNPDEPVGRKHLITPPPAKVIAEKLNLPLFQPEKLTEEHIKHIQSFGADIGIVVAYGKILPQTLIDSFPFGMLNIHYSLLPKYRGASPVESALLWGDATTGVTIQKLVFKLDAGPVVGVREVPIDSSVTTPELKDLLTKEGSELLLEILPQYLEGDITPIEQDESKASHCGKIAKSDGEIKLTDPDNEKWLKYRAYFTWPGIFYFDTEGKRVKITEAIFENDKFVIKKIIPEGKKEMAM
jgi:methionyl-tRNA formyltransferase